MTRFIPIVFSLFLTAGTTASHAQIAWFSQGNADESPSFLGVLLQDVTSENVDSLGLKREQGALCAEIVPDSPAGQAGLEADDVIVRWDGMRVRSARQLKRLVEDTPVGRTVKVVILRDGENQDLQATVGERAALAMRDMPFHNFDQGQIPLGPWHPPIDGNANPFSEFAPDGPVRLGVAMQDLTDQLARYFGLDDGASGVLVVSVVEDSPAEEAGLRAGDVITEINGAEVAGAADVQALVRRAGDHAEITLLRNKKVRHMEAVFEGAEEADDETEPKEDDISYPRGTM